MFTFLNSSVHKCVVRQALGHDASVSLSRSLVADLSFSKHKDLSGLFSKTAVKPFTLLGADSSCVPGGNGEWQRGRGR